MTILDRSYQCEFVPSKPTLPLLAFAGRKGSGKGAAADVLVREGWVPVAFADPIKRLVREVFGYPDAVLFGPSAARDEVQPCYRDLWPGVQSALTAGRCRAWFPRRSATEVRAHLADVLRALPASSILTPRVVLQQVGTTWGQGLDPRVWTRELAYVVTQLERGATYTPSRGFGPVADVRPPGVVVTDARFEHEFHCVKRLGGRVYWVERGLAPSGDSHASETDVIRDLADAVIDNTGDLRHLEEQVRRLV